MHFIQIPKFIKEKRGCKTKLEQWMQFISQESKGEVELAMKENEEIRKANEEYEYLTGDEEERRLAILREDAMRDQNTRMLGAREEGIELGIAQGEKKKQIEIAQRLLKLGINIDDIQKATELSKEEIEKLEQ